MAPVIDSTAFVESVRPFLAAHDAAGLTEHLRAHWSDAQVAGLLSAADADARKVAALCLALFGGRPAVNPLCHGLSDNDPLVHQMAEHALWSIWFRLGRTPAANTDLCRGAKAVGAREFDRAVEHFGAALAADPRFAEAYNQRAIAHYLTDAYAASIADCRHAIRIMPCHFGAWAGMGHCYLHLDRLTDALRCYRRALDIHPHLEGVRQAAGEICSRLGPGADDQCE